MSLIIIVFDSSETGQWPLWFYCRENLQGESVVYVRDSSYESRQCTTG